MGNFFEKLKKGMGIDEGMIEHKPQLIPQTSKKPKKKVVVKKPIEIKIEKVELSPVPLKSGTAEDKEKKVEKIEPAFVPLSAESRQQDKEKSFEKERDLSGQEGQLAVDVYQTKNDLVIQSAIAGIKAEDLDISIENDTLIIKGEREKPDEKEQDYFTQECYWGIFSRKIILPVEVDPSRISAKMKQGILTISLPKIEREKKRKVVVKE